MKEGNLVSFAVRIDTEGKFITELSYLPIKEVGKIFRESDSYIVEKIIRIVYENVAPLHKEIEEEISSMNH